MLLFDIGRTGSEVTEGFNPSHPVLVLRRFSNDWLRRLMYSHLVVSPVSRINVSKTFTTWCRSAFTVKRLN